MGMPMFPNKDGGWCSKTGFVNTVAELARRTGTPTVDLLGRTTVGEHVWRVTGSRHLAALDVPIIVIKLLARWGGDVVERYVADAPLTALTKIYINKVAAYDVAARGLAGGLVSGRGQAVEDQVRRLRGVPETTSLANQDAELGARFTPFVASITGKVHLVSSPPRLARTDLERTPCGWVYRCSPHTLLEEVPVQAHCCKQCGSEAVWGDAHALLSILQAGYESE